MAGGMAGGSADAAGALLACDTLWGTGASRAELLDICAELGSDVPFSLVGGAALGRGRGELLEPLEVGGTFHWVFAVADGGLSTPAVYRECDRLREASGRAPRCVTCPIRSPPPPCWRRCAPATPSRSPPRWPTTSRPPPLSLRPALADDAGRGHGGRCAGRARLGLGADLRLPGRGPGAGRPVAKALLASGTCRTVRVTSGPVPGATVIGR